MVKAGSIATCDFADSGSAVGRVDSVERCRCRPPGKNESLTVGGPFERMNHDICGGERIGPLRKVSDSGQAERGRLLQFAGKCEDESLSFSTLGGNLDVFGRLN